MTRADVYKDGTLAALLSTEGSDTVFRYQDRYEGPAVAHSLPLGAEVRRPGRSVPAFFANLLPEGRRLSALQRAVKTSADDELSLLLEVGADTIGDVQVVPEGASPSDAVPLVSEEAPDFSQLLDDYGVDPVAIPGAQSKLSAGMITVPGRTHSGDAAIIKLNPPDYPWAVENEHYFLRAARSLKLPVAQAALTKDRHGTPGLVVERFDRSEGRRSAVEDACQLLGRYPSDKYLLSAEEVASAVADACPARPVALRNVFLQFMFAWLMGNGDLHAKNVSVLQGPSGEWAVAPLYDVLSTLPYGDHTMALSMGGRNDGFVRKHLVSFGVDLGLPTRAAESALQQALDATAGLDDDLASGALPFDANLTRTLRRQLARRRRDAVGS